MALEGLQLGRYRLLHIIGKGGMGEVYLADDIRMPRQVAVKVVQTESVGYPDKKAIEEAARLFQREMRVIVALDHPHILQLFDYGEETMHNTTLTYMVMPFLKEGSLNDWLQKRTTAELLPAYDVAYIIEQAADALQHAHDLQIVHQDIKPSNFLIRTRKDKPNRPDLLLADFGIAKMTNATATASQTVRGTPGYMAPEQWSGEPVYASDQYALAVLAYELLAGHPPFKGRQEQVMYQHLMMQPQPPSTLNPRLSKEVDVVILKALAKKPEERFSSISAFAQALQESVQGNKQAPQAEVPPAVKAPDRPSSDELHATLAISKAEALTGTNRTLTLPGGKKVTVPIPTRAYEGQVIRIRDASTTTTLVLTLTIQQAKEPTSALDREDYKRTISSSNPGFIAPPALTPHATFSTPAPTTPASRSNTFNTPAPLTPAPSSNPSGQPIPIVRSTSVGDRQIAVRPKPRRTGAITLLVLVVLLVLSGVVGLAVYNNQANYTNQPNSYPPNTATLVLNDLLNSNNGSAWTENNTCQFNSGAYHVIGGTQNNSTICLYSGNFRNFAFEVQMQIIQGYCGGISFRADGSGNQYIFFVCSDSTYSFGYTVYGALSPLLTPSQAASINVNPGQINTIGAVANGNTIDLYVNNQHATSIQDNTFIQGGIGVIASNDSSSSSMTEVAYKNAKVWTF